MTNYNLGQQYERKIQELLRVHNLLPQYLHGNDAGFIHKDKEYYLEVKNKLAPDFGQKRLIWNIEKGWEWSKKDIMTDMFEEDGIFNYIDKDFIPRRYTVPKEKITLEDRKYDQQKIKKSNIKSNNRDYISEYYYRKSCHYIQIQGKGFYYLKNDIADLKVPQFSPGITLRLRAKAHHMNPPNDYSFFVVINIKPKSVLKSKYDLEELVGGFPPITK